MSEQQSTNGILGKVEIGEEFRRRLEKEAETPEMRRALALYDRLFAQDAGIARLYAADAMVMSTEDGLTGLHNRRWYDEEIERLVESLKGSDVYFSLIMIDADNLRQINTKKGHPGGDQYLITVAKVLNKVLGEKQGARIGGDEFAILLLGIKYKDVYAISQIIREEFEQMKIGKGLDPMCGLSMGVAVWDRRMSSEELYKKADLELYADKENRKAKGLRF